MGKMQKIQCVTISNINIHSYRKGSIENISGEFESNIHNLWRSFIMKDRIYINFRDKTDHDKITLDEMESHKPNDMFVAL